MDAAQSVVDVTPNLAAWNALAPKYADLRFLWPAEKTILQHMESQGLANMRMLDVGVGAGRTTEFFQPVAQHYVGVDYSPAMIDVCRRRFAGQIDEQNLVVGDARDLHWLADGSFDFAMFSFNGIDNCRPEDRAVALRELRRVLRDDGWLCISSHNVDWQDICAAYRLLFRGSIKHPRSYVVGLVKHLIFQVAVRLRNRHISMRAVIEPMRRAGIGSFYDELPGEAGVRTVYVRCGRQCSQLLELGFDRIRTYSTSGVEFLPTDGLSGESWIYYLARKRLCAVAPRETPERILQGMALAVDAEHAPQPTTLANELPAH